MFRLILPILVMSLPLAACSFGAPPPSPAEQAIRAACTKQANAIDAAQNYVYLSRPNQIDTPFLGPPNPDYLNDKRGALLQRDQRVNDCVRNSNPAYVGTGAGLPEPKIIGPSQ